MTQNVNPLQAIIDLMIPSTAVKELIEQDNPYTLDSIGPENQFQGLFPYLQKLQEYWKAQTVQPTLIVHSKPYPKKSPLIQHITHLLSTTEATVAYLNLPNFALGGGGIRELLLAITSSIAEVTAIAPPSEQQMLEQPYIIFKNYLTEVEAELKGNLVIVLDKFEVLLELIMKDRLPRNLPDYLQECLSPKVAFAICCTSKSVESVFPNLPIPNLTSFLNKLIPVHVKETRQQFKGRENILRKLEKFWMRDNKSSTIIFGQPGIGKTSLIHYASQRLINKVAVAYLDLKAVARLNQFPEDDELLIAIADSIADATAITFPSNEEMLEQPYDTFRVYLAKVEKEHSKKLIIALDEFEVLLDLISEGYISDDFIDYLQRCVPSGVGLAVCCTQYYGAFTASDIAVTDLTDFFSDLVPVGVSFLSLQETDAVLKEFRTYTDEAVKIIYELTHGHPFSVQIIGYLLVHYGDKTKQSAVRNYSFTSDDVNKLIDDGKLFSTKYGEYCFKQLWSESILLFDLTTKSAEEVLKSIASKKQGITLEELIERTKKSESEELLSSDLELLIHNEIVTNKEGKYSITIELFRLWILSTKVSFKDSLNGTQN